MLSMLFEVMYGSWYRMVLCYTANASMLTTLKND